MALRIKDLPTLGEGLNRRLERNAARRGQEAAESLLSSTAQGRGLWVIFLWPAWLLIVVASGVFFEALLRKFGIAPPLSWGGYLGGLVLGQLWYGADFTRRHPFLGAVLGYFGTAMAVSLLAGKLGL